MVSFTKSFCVGSGFSFSDIKKRKKIHFKTTSLVNNQWFYLGRGLGLSLAQGHCDMFVTQAILLLACEHRCVPAVTGSTGRDKRQLQIRPSAFAGYTSCYLHVGVFINSKLSFMLIDPNSQSLSLFSIT